MEKQVSSSLEEKREKFNQTSIFLTRFIFGENFDLLKKLGFVDTYTSDPEVTNLLTLGESQRIVFLLFKNKNMSVNEIRKIIVELFQTPVQVVFSYELVNDYSMIVIDFPEKYTTDYDYFVKGMYSKFSEGFKEKFPITRDVLNEKGQRLGAEYTMYYHIFNKTDWLRDLWMKKLDLCELDEKVELWEKPKDSDLIFDISKTIKNQ